MISSHHAVDIGTACLQPITRSSLHSTIRLSCQSRQSSINLVAGCLCVRPALPAAFCSRRKLSAARPICPECSSATQNFTAPQTEHAGTGNKVQRKRQRPLLSYCCNSQKHQASDNSADLHCSGPAKLSRSPTAAAEALSFSRYRAVRNGTCNLQSDEQSPFCTLHLALQLLRIETEGAYAGLVAGSPIADDLDSASRSVDIQLNASVCTFCALAGRQSHQQICR